MRLRRWRAGKRGTLDPVLALLDAAAGRRDRLEADRAAFMTERGSRDISGLSREEVRELFAILLARARLDAETRVLRQVIRRLSP